MDLKKTIANSSSSQKRSKFRFSLQSLLLLLLAAGIGFAWLRDHRQLKQEIHELRFPRQAWDTRQITGPPDTPGYGDYGTAWASLTPDSQDEWLIAEYDWSVSAKAIVVHETYNPGAISSVTVFNGAGQEIEIWSSSDPAPKVDNTGATVFPVSKPVRTYRVKLYIDSKAVAGWNEIDAVGLQDARSKIHWASDATASSSYAENNLSISGTIYNVVGLRR